MGEGDLDGAALAALALAAVGWVAFLVAVFVADDPWPFLLLGVASGGVALALGLSARRRVPAAAGGAVATVAGVTLYGLTVVAFMTALVYATGVLLLVVLIVLLVAMGSGPWWASGGGGGGGCACPTCDGGGCCACGDCCDCASCCACGDCCDCASCCACGDCCDCASCCGGGCACAGLALWPRVASSLPPLVERLAHHPDLPEYAEDVYRVRGVRLCVGCFTTFPAFLLASAVLALAPAGLAWEAMLGAGALLALAQGVSSAGLARRRAVKALVKLCLGVGLALVTMGVHAAPWPPAWKLAALLAAAALAYASAVPRARRMRHRRAAG